MGIAKLLPFVEEASEKCNISRFSGKTAAVDAYVLLHKGAFGCAEKLFKGEPTTTYITYFMRYMNILMENNIKPIVVLDGRNLPAKELTEMRRKEDREENRKLTTEYLDTGRSQDAKKCFSKCIDITPIMARELIKVLRENKIDYVVAPYEADAQLAYLTKTGAADFVITIDSDLIVFGCDKIFFKMDEDGNGVFFDQSKLYKCLGLTTAGEFNFDKFRWICILSGCDYLKNISGIGLKRAMKVVNSNHGSVREMILSIPNVETKVDSTEKYIEAFIQAENTFLYQLVFDTHKRALVPLNAYPEGIDGNNMSYAGAYLTNEIAVDLALGNLDIETLEKVDSFDPLQSNYPPESIWSIFIDSGEKEEISDDKSEEIAQLFDQLNINEPRRPLVCIIQ